MRGEGSDSSIIRQGGRAAERSQFTTGHRLGQGEGVTAEHVDVLVTERRQTRHVLVADIESLGPELVEGSIHVDRVPQDDGVDDQAKGAELILLALAVALAQFTALAVENDAGELVTALAAVELVKYTAAVGFIVDVGPADRAS